MPSSQISIIEANELILSVKQILLNTIDSYTADIIHSIYDQTKLVLINSKINTVKTDINIAFDALITYINNHQSEIESNNQTIIEELLTQINTIKNITFQKKIYELFYDIDMILFSIENVNVIDNYYNVYQAFIVYIVQAFNIYNDNFYKILVNKERINVIDKLNNDLNTIYNNINSFFITLFDTFILSIENFDKSKYVSNQKNNINIELNYIKNTITTFINTNMGSINNTTLASYIKRQWTSTVFNIINNSITKISSMLSMCISLFKKDYDITSLKESMDAITTLQHSVLSILQNAAPNDESVKQLISLNKELVTYSSIIKNRFNTEQIQEQPPESEPQQSTVVLDTNGYPPCSLQEKDDFYMDSGFGHNLNEHANNVLSDTDEKRFEELLKSAGDIDIDNPESRNKLYDKIKNDNIKERTFIIGFAPYV